MSSEVVSIAEITAARETWTIKAKVVRLWLVPDFNRPNLPFSMDMVLMDERGDRVQASVRRTLIYKFQKQLQEGAVYSIHYFGVAANTGDFKTTPHTYKINFQYGTRVSLLNNEAVTGSIFSFVPIADICGGVSDVNLLVDVIGLLKGVGQEREFERNGSKMKMNVISLEADGSKIECTLFGPYVDDLNSFLESGDEQNVVVIIQFAKVKSFQGKIHLQNAMSSTKLIFNPVCAEATELRERMSGIMESPSQGLSQLTDSTSISVVDDFLKMTPAKTIQALKECKMKGSYVVLGTVKHVLDDEDWWYTACSCGRSVIPDSKMFFCDICIKHMLKVFPRYRIKIRVIDETDSATFVMFDRDASILLNRTCADMIDLSDKTSDPGRFPKEKSEIVDRTLLFKVEFQELFNSRFLQSFTIKKVCTDAAIIEQFRELYCKPMESISVNAYLIEKKLALSQDVSGDVAQDLMNKFSDAVVDKQSQCGEEECGEKEGIDLSKDSNDMTPLKRDFAAQQGDAEIEGPVKIMKRDIKIEKD